MAEPAPGPHERRRPVHFDGLEPAERVVAWLPVRLRRATGLAALQAGPSRVPTAELLSLGTLGARRRARRDRARPTAGSGVPIGRSDVVLGVTDRHRILVWRAGGMRLHPGRLKGEIEPGTLTQAVAGTGLRPGLTLATRDGLVVELTPLRRRNLDAVITALGAAITAHR